MKSGYLLICKKKGQKWRFTCEYPVKIKEFTNGCPYHKCTVSDKRKQESQQWFTNCFYSVVYTSYYHLELGTFTSPDDTFDGQLLFYEMYH